MSVKQVQIWEIIDYLLSIPSIEAIVDDRIYFGLPINDTQEGIYITINILSEIQSFLNKWTILEFKFIAPNIDTPFSELLDLRSLVSDELYSKLKFSSSFSSYNCYEDWNFKNWYDEKNRRILIQDYRIYFLN